MNNKSARVPQGALKPAKPRGQGQGRYKSTVYLCRHVFAAMPAWFEPASGEQPGFPLKNIAGMTAFRALVLCVGILLQNERLVYRVSTTEGKPCNRNPILQ